MKDHPAPVQRLAHRLLVSHITFYQADVAKGLGQVVAPAAGEVVEHRHVVPKLHQVVDQV